MTIHKEGYRIIGISALVLGLINVLFFYFPGARIQWVSVLIFFITLCLFIFILMFFRVPNRTLTYSEDKIISPADGKVVVIEEITDEEYFHDRRIQVSIFMSPLNIHLNRIPVTGNILYSKYHTGKYLVAWHPKSSTLNERHSIVAATKHGPVLVKQIAGAMAKRISNYASPGNTMQQGDELGFIKFGSRVDVLLPINTNIEVQMGQLVKCGITVLASFA
jgi:phosphatidylserine decarboxylase